MFPEDERVKRLAQAVTDRLKLRDESPRLAPTTPGPVTPGPRPTATHPDSTDKGPARLTDAQINTIRLYEIKNIARERPAVTIANDVMQEAFRKYAGRGARAGHDRRAAAVSGADGWVKLELLKSLDAKDLWKKATVTTDVDAIANFRQNIQSSYVLNCCASAQCHGGDKAGDFYLFQQRTGGAAATAYTNFYILTQYSKGKGYMVDRLLPRAVVSGAVRVAPGGGDVRAPGDAGVEAAVRQRTGFADRTDRGLDREPGQSGGPVQPGVQDTDDDEEGRAGAGRSAAEQMNGVGVNRGYGVAAGGATEVAG